MVDTTALKDRAQLRRMNTVRMLRELERRVARVTELVAATSPGPKTALLIDSASLAFSDLQVAIAAD